ncbi:MAG: hypothetical protein WCP52_10035 [Bacteroidota bacterium]
MKKTGWKGSSNPFIYSMERSLQNAVSIIVYHLYRLLAHKGESAGHLAMYTDFEPAATIVINLASKKTGDKESQSVLTADFESVFRDMSTKLDDFDSLVRAVHHVNTTPYNLIMGRTRDRFYNGSYEERIGALKAMEDIMTAQLVPLGAAAVKAYRLEIEARHEAQQLAMTEVGNDATDLMTNLAICTKKLNKNRGWLIFNHGDDDNCQAIVNTYYPLNLLGDRSAKGHYQLIVPKAEFRRICIHTFLPGESVDLVIGDADVWISMADDATHAIASGYRAVAGSTVTVNPTVFGDLTKKYVIATNASLTTSSDVIFNIVK